MSSGEIRRLLNPINVMTVWVTPEALYLLKWDRQLPLITLETRKHSFCFRHLSPYHHTGMYTHHWTRFPTPLIVPLH